MAYEPSEVTAGSTSSSSTPPLYPQGTSSEQIRRDIQETRAEMDQTVDSLQERLKPRHLLDDILDAFRGSSSSSGGSSASSGDSFKEIGSRIVDKFKENPMPAALIGAGVAWLLFEGDGKRTRSGYRRNKWDVPDYSGSYVDARTGQPYTAGYGRGAMQGSGGEASGVMDRAKETVSGAAGKMSSAAGVAKDTAGGAMQSAKEAASAIADKASEWAGAARESAEGAGSAISEYASGASDQAYRGYRASKHYVERGIEEYPLAMGAAALALGMLSGLLLPRTETEDRLMGEQSDDLKNTVKAAGEEVLESGKHVAAATVSAAQDEASRQGAGADSLVEKVKHVVQDVKNAATESARREGLDPDSLAQKGKEVAGRAKEAAKEETQRQKDQATG